MSRREHAASPPFTVRTVLGALGRLALTVAAAGVLLGLARIAPFVDDRPQVGLALNTPLSPGNERPSVGVISIDGIVCAVEDRQVDDCAGALAEIVQPGPDGNEPYIVMDERGPEGGTVTWITGMPPLGPHDPLPDLPPAALTYHLAEAHGCGGACPGVLRHYAYAADTAPAASAPAAAARLPEAPLVQRIGWFDSGQGVALTLDRTDDLAVTVEAMDVLLRAEGWQAVPAAAGGTFADEGVAGTYSRNGSVLLLVPDHDLEGDLLLTVRQGPGA